MVRHNLYPRFQYHYRSHKKIVKGGDRLMIPKEKVIIEPLVTLNASDAIMIELCHAQLLHPSKFPPSSSIKYFMQGQKTACVTMILPREPHRYEYYFWVIYYLPAVVFLLVFLSILYFRSSVFDHVAV